MHNCFNISIAKKYNSESQRIRVMSEHWVETEIVCPACIGPLNRFKNNQPVADFYCPSCREEFELKSKKNSIGRKLTDGAFSVMMERLISDNHPSLMLIRYSKMDYRVNDFIIIPKHFFIPSIIEKRAPLKPSARRAGWVGCNILIDQIPKSGKIFILRNGTRVNPDAVKHQWDKSLFIRKMKNPNLKGWMLDTMKCIDRLDKVEFTLQEMYHFETELQKKYPDNRHIRDKIRQQLQYLRDNGYIHFVKRGQYRLVE